MTQKERKEYKDLRDKKWLYISQLRSKVLEHPDYKNCEIAVDMLMDSSCYECGIILGISPSREEFDDLYDYSDLYRGGLCEIKVGNNYVIYGFDFD